MTTQIPLSRGLVSIVDDADARAVGVHKWHAFVREGRTTYAQGRIGGKTILLHVFLTGLSGVDHINGDGLDNRRENLRPASVADNNRNVGLRSDNKSGYKGVTWHKHAMRWRARIKVNGQEKYLGHFDTAEEAAVAYDAEAIRSHGKFARPNFPVTGAGDQSAISAR